MVSSPMNDSRKNILFVTYGFSMGGSERVLVTLLNNLSKSMIQPIVVSLGGGNEMRSHLDQSVRVLEFKRRWKYDLSPAKLIRRVIQEYQIKIAMTLSWLGFFYVKRASHGIDPPVRIVATLHSAKPLSLKHYLTSLMHARQVGRNDYLVAVSKNQMQYLSRILLIPIRKFQVVHNGVDTGHWILGPPEFDKSAFRRSLQIPEGEPVIIQVAGLRKEKKHEHSLRALQVVHLSGKSRPFLLFVGGGTKDARERLSTLAKQLGVNSYVRFCGEQIDLRPYYWSSDLFTLSSVTEAFSMAALEAMASGLPCVLTDVGGATEMVTEGVNGLVVPPHRPDLLAGGWMRILEDPTSYQPEAIRRFVEERFSLNGMMQKYQELLTHPVYPSAAEEPTSTPV